MPSAEEAWGEMSASQHREIRTAVVLTTLGPIVRSNISSIVSAMKPILQNAVIKLESKEDKNDQEEKLLSFLRDISTASASLDGIKKLESMNIKAESMPGLLLIAKQCFNTLPSVLRFPGFASLIKHNALSKFISFATSWRYSGVGYDPPKGMSEPFSGYDDIINSLIGHPKCVAEFKRQGELWERAQKKKAA